MIATTSHDLRTPINSIKNMLGLLTEEVKTKKGQYYLKVCN
jgi:signal transduction histidine kinase